MISFHFDYNILLLCLAGMNLFPYAVFKYLSLGVIYAEASVIFSIIFGKSPLIRAGLHKT
jgi:hypothetical protein